ncbi:CatA-like O-acetyltransferase [Winogradskyella haliclonae]|uniref:Chloramphenicol acetyltransferase n=1 Tax=Winogradskyella haliclonae TaxID=2048558 RepID=A0ABQ2BZE6_9FLAO|nr:CatA-like O-acetyltransferase [Winogradskyella haliclonae]GGI57301.1 chloramphenicol acetyltransferase [Winogradskyella haliclonae]
MNKSRVDIANWNRKEHFEFFNTFHDPYFGVTFKVDVTKMYAKSKSNAVSFFALYLHACTKAINSVENLRYRIDSESNVVCFDKIHASATILRPDNTFGFSFIDFEQDFERFNKNYEAEKSRIFNSSHLFPPKNSLDCFHCSALPWVNFTGHKEPCNGVKDSVPKIAFSKTEVIKDKQMINIAISVNHALVDGYHIGLFLEKFQYFLNQ